MPHADTPPTAHFAAPPSASPIVNFNAFIPNQTPDAFDQKAYLGLVSAQASAAGGVGAVAAILSVSAVGRRRLVSQGISVATLVTFPVGQDTAAGAMAANMHSSDAWLQNLYGAEAGATSISTANLSRWTLILS